MRKCIKSLIAIIIIFNISNIYPLFNNTYAENSTETTVATQDNIEQIDQYIYSQPTFHPRKEDFFGNNINVVPIYRVGINQYDTYRQNKICLTFDSAYINDYTFKILDTLDQYGAKATFFMTAEWAAKNPTHVQEISKRGHEIGNHTWSHPNLNLYSDEAVVNEIVNCHNLMKSILGIDMCLFRFPYGSFSMRTLNIIKELGYYPIQWTFDSIDWKNESKDAILKRFRHTDKLVPGAIVLCHNGATYTPECLPEILELLKSKGLECVRVSDLIYHHNFYIANGLQIHKTDEQDRFIGDDSETE